MVLYLIDGTAFIYRAYHAINGLRTSTGFPTNAIFGFIRAISKLQETYKPDDMFAIAFDEKGPTKRHELYKNYKATRPPIPDELVCQIKPIREYLELANIKYYVMSGYEADDILATLAISLQKEVDEVFIVTSDKDLLQIISKKIKVLDPIKDTIYDEEFILNKYKLPPARLTELMALTGDKADNIPGVKGIGEKTAITLLKDFNSLEEVLLNTDKIRAARTRERIILDIENINISKELVTIDTRVPVKFTTDELKPKQPKLTHVREFYKKYELYSLLNNLPKDNIKVVKTPVHLKTAKELDTILNQNQDSSIAFTVHNDIRLNFSFDGNNDEYEFLLNVQNTPFLLKSLFQDHRTFIGYDAKKIIHILMQNNINLVPNIYDTMLGAFLLNSNKQTQDLQALFIQYTGGENDLILLKNTIFTQLENQGLLEVYKNYESPLFKVLADMENSGVTVNLDKLKNISKQLKKEIDGLTKRIYELSGTIFNINSPKQLQEVLFHKLGLNPQRKIKTGYSTDNSALEAMSHLHPLPEIIIEYRNLTKLKNSYIDALPASVNSVTGKIHTTFNQTGTATGRISTNSPNLQSIPVKGDFGKQIREAFSASDGHVILCADYSQIELRLLAHLSKDHALIEAFKNEQDIHSETAKAIFDLSAITEDMRRAAKAVNFGIVYGISAFGLSENLKISQGEAKSYIDGFFKKHTGVKEFIEKTIIESKKTGNIRTILGRVRSIPELNSKSKATQTRGERQAINSIIQGSAADIIKLAMLNIHKEFNNRNINASMVLQVHDELVFEVPERERTDNTNGILPLVIDLMENVYQTLVPLKVKAGYGNNWAEASS